jgi:hypothetical protein
VSTHAHLIQTVARLDALVDHIALVSIYLVVVLLHRPPFSADLVVDLGLECHLFIVRIQLLVAPLLRELRETKREESASVRRREGKSVGGKSVGGKSVGGKSVEID